MHNEDNTKSIKLDINDAEVEEKHGSTVNVSLTDLGNDSSININAADGFRHTGSNGKFSNLYSDGLDIDEEDYRTNIRSNSIFIANNGMGGVVGITTNKKFTEDEKYHGYSPVDISLTDGNFKANINAKNGFTHKTDDGFTSNLDGYGISCKVG